MRRPITSSAPSKPVPQAPNSNGSTTIPPVGHLLPVRRNRRRTRLRNTGSGSVGSLDQNGGGSNHNNSTSHSRSSPSYAMFFLVFVVLLVLADLLYLYKISSQAFSNGQGHSWGWRATHLSRVAVGGDGSKNAVSTAASAIQQTVIGPKKTATQFEEEGKFAGLVNLDDKGPILKILHQAGMDILDFDQEIIDSLPTWTQVQQLYGTSPRVIGLEKCEEFVQSTDPTIRFFGVAGTFNSGTNLVAELMTKNCQITERMAVYGSKSTGVRWQVPWGKHYPASHRGQHETDTDKVVPYTNSLPLVAIREPYMWLQSMCRHGYEAKWPHTKKHCPNLIATEDEIRTLPILRNKYWNADVTNEELLVPLTIFYDDMTSKYTSLAHFWSEWYQLYMDADFPRIIVRFEDLLFYGEEVTEALCKCGGGVPRDGRPSNSFVHISESAKLGTAAHGNHKTNLLGAIIRYGNFDHRLDNMTSADLAAARKYFDSEIMEIFGYHHPDASMS